MILERPTAAEYNPYYDHFISLVGEGDLLQILADSYQKTDDLLKDVTEEQANSSYAEGKWTIKELLVHLADTERVFGYRSMSIARGDQTAFPGFEHNDYVPLSGANERPLSDILEELSSIRASTISLFRGMPKEGFSRIGTASDSPASPLAIACIVVGHETHHRGVLEERYSIHRL